MINAFFEIRFRDLVHLASRRDASDIHVVPGARPSIRVDGRLEFVDGPAVAADECAAIMERSLAGPALQRFIEFGDATATFDGIEGIRLRVHGLRTGPGIALAIRILPRSVPTMESLHLPAVVRALMQRSRGLIVFAGPTGSGKSTSLAAAVACINSEQRRRIVTIEDPIEYCHESLRSVITQREVGRDVPSFANAVIESLRADPDVIMIGEMRDNATMRAAMTAAETGHLVLTTLHTGDAVQTIDRIVDAFPGSEQGQIRAQLSASLVAVICQRLLPRANGPGRRVAAEILIATDGVRTTIREARTHQLRNLMLTGRQAGMQTLEHHLSELLAERQIDRTIATAVTDRGTELREVAGTILP